jgi:hypothetical protein
LSNRQENLNAAFSLLWLPLDHLNTVSSRNRWYRPLQPERYHEQLHYIIVLLELQGHKHGRTQTQKHFVSLVFRPVHLHFFGWCVARLKFVELNGRSIPTQKPHLRYPKASHQRIGEIWLSKSCNFFSSPSKISVRLKGWTRTTT